MLLSRFSDDSKDLFDFLGELKSSVLVRLPYGDIRSFLFSKF